MPDVLMYRMQPNAELVDTYADNPRGYFEADNTLHYQTNSAGFRGPEIGPGNGRVTVAFLEDSFTFGEGVRDQDTFAYRTAEMLRRAGRGDVVARNYGMLGFNSLQGRILLESEVLPQKPDAVVVGDFLNDASKTVFGIVNGEVVNQSDEVAHAEIASALSQELKQLLRDTRE